MGTRFLWGESHLGSYAWNKLYDRCVFKGVCFPNRKKYEDIHIILKLLHNAVSFKILPECKYYYVQRDGSIVHEFKKVNADILMARREQLEQARQFSLNEEILRTLEMLVIKEQYSVYRDVLRLPASEAVAYHDIAEECKSIVHSEMFKQVPFSFKRRFWTKILTAPLYKLFWKWKRH